MSLQLEPKLGHVMTRYLGTLPQIYHIKPVHLGPPDRAPRAQIMASLPVTQASLGLISRLHAALNDPTLPLSKRYRALFGLKHHACLVPGSDATVAAIDAIASAFATPSALLKHEVAYCLGQTRNLATTPYLQAVLRNRQEDDMVRHEAAEALGAVGDRASLDLLRERRDDESEAAVVRETCEIAIESVEWQAGDKSRNEKLRTRWEAQPLPLRAEPKLTVSSSDFASVDPAPPLPESEKGENISALQSMLLDTTLPLFRRYRAMFALRDLASPPTCATAIPAVEALASGFGDSSALFRHEIAFVFGQLSHPASIPALTRVLEDQKEASMVRHEAAEALGSLGDNEGVWKTLRDYLEDKDQLVRESIMVALDMAEFERSGELEYAKLADGDGAAPAPLTAVEAS